MSRLVGGKQKGYITSGFKANFMKRFVFVVSNVLALAICAVTAQAGGWHGGGGGWHGGGGWRGGLGWYGGGCWPAFGFGIGLGLGGCYASYGSYYSYPAYASYYSYPAYTYSYTLPPAVTAQPAYGYQATQTYRPAAPAAVSTVPPVQAQTAIRPSTGTWVQDPNPYRYTPDPSPGKVNTSPTPVVTVPGAAIPTYIVSQ